MNGKFLRFLKELKSLFFITDIRTFLRYCGLIIVNLPEIVRRKYLGAASEKMTGRNYTFRVFGRPITLEGKYFGRATELYARKVYFALPQFRLDKDMIVVDLGANIGAFSILAALLAKKVVAVEAIYPILEELKTNARQNHCLEKIEPVWGAVGPGSGMMAQPALPKEIFGDAKPPILTIDGLLEKYNLPKIDFLKIDIEGSEFDLFKGNLGWLPKVKLIAMEVHRSLAVSGISVPCGDIAEISKVLKGAGFKVCLLDVNQRRVSEIKDQAGYLYAENLQN